MVFSISHFTAETKYFQVKHLILIMYSGSKTLNVMS